MSLRTDQFFFNAIAGTEIDTMVNGRIFNPARTTVDEDEDKMPYIIITLDSVKNDSGTKDDVEGLTDTVQVSILCAATDREALADMTEAVRARCREYLDEVETEGTEEEKALAPYDWTFSADGVQYDMLKPCVYQTLRYECGTNRD